MSIKPVTPEHAVPSVEGAEAVAAYLDRHTKNLSVVLAGRLKAACSIDAARVAAAHGSEEAIYYEFKAHDETRDGAAELQGVRTLRALYSNARNGKHGEKGAVILPNDDPFMRRVDQEMYRYIGRFVEIESGITIPAYEDLSNDQVVQICKIGQYTVLRGSAEGTPFVFYATEVDQA